MGDWISVDDRLPEHGQHVLVWSDVDCFIGIGDDENGALRIGDCVFRSEHDKRYDRNQWKGRFDGSYFIGVTHWQPLPEAPEEVRNVYQTR